VPTFIAWKQVGYISWGESRHPETRELSLFLQHNVTHCLDAEYMLLKHVEMIFNDLHSVTIVVIVERFILFSNQWSIFYDGGIKTNNQFSPLARNLISTIESLLKERIFAWKQKCSLSTIHISDRAFPDDQEIIGRRWSDYKSLSQLCKVASAFGFVFIAFLE
jgi:hypothetical protein